MSDNSVTDNALYTQVAGYSYILTPYIIWENAGRRDEMMPVTYSAVGSIPFSRPALADKSHNHSICLTLTNTDPLVRGNCGRRSGCFEMTPHLTTCAPDEDDKMFVNQSGLLSQDQGTYLNQSCVPWCVRAPARQNGKQESVVITHHRIRVIILIVHLRSYYLLPSEDECNRSTVEDRPRRRTMPDLEKSPLVKPSRCESVKSTQKIIYL